MLFLAICFYTGITNSSAIQRYRDQHEFRKTELDDNTSRATAMQERIFDNTDAEITTERAANVNVTQSSTLSLRPTISRSSAIQRYRDLHEFRKPNLMNDKIPKTINIQKNNIDDTGVKKTPNGDTIMTSSLFWSLFRFPSETGLRSFYKHFKLSEVNFISHFLYLKQFEDNVKGWFIRYRSK